MLNPIFAANRQEISFNLGFVSAQINTPIALIGLLILGGAKAYNYMQKNESEHITVGQVVKCTFAIGSILTITVLALTLMFNRPLQERDLFID